MRDERVEQWLQSYGIVYKYLEDLQIEAILIDKETKENIRMTERLDDDLVLRYGVALENGAKFPGIVVFPFSNGKPPRYGLINGLHRIASHKLADQKTIAAYVAKVSDKLIISVLRRTANTLEGKPPTMPEMIEQAAWLVRQGYTVVDASRLMSVPPKRLNERCLYDKVRARLASMGVDVTDLSVPYSGFTRMSSLRDKHLKEVAALSHEARLSSDRVQELCSLVRDAASDEDADRILNDWRKMYADEIQRNRGGTVRNPASPLRRLPAVLMQAERMMSQHKDKAASLRPEEAKSLIAACRKTIMGLEHMIKRLEEVIASAVA